MFIHCRLQVAFARPTDDIIIVANSLIMQESAFIIACVIIFQGRHFFWQPGVLFISTVHGAALLRQMSLPVSLRRRAIRRMHTETVSTLALAEFDENCGSSTDLKSGTNCNSA